MSDIWTVEFFKLEIGDDVGEIVEATLIPFEDAASFQEWAQRALPDRRNKWHATWPDAIRARSNDGTEVARWTLWDQMRAGKPLTA